MGELAEMCERHFRDQTEDGTLEHRIRAVGLKNKSYGDAPSSEYCFAPPQDWLRLHIQRALAKVLKYRSRIAT